MKSDAVSQGKMPDYGNNCGRKPQTFTGPDGTYFDTVDRYTPSESTPHFMEGSSGGRHVDPGVSWGGGGDCGGGGGAFLG